MTPISQLKAIETVKAMTQPQTFVEVFPILLENLSPLTAYRVQLDTDDPHVVQAARGFGGKLAYRLRAALHGSWVWVGSRLLTDTPPNPARLIMAVENARREQGALYKHLDSIEEDFGWEATAETLANYVVRGPLAALEGRISEALAATAFPLRNARVEREHRARAWVVDHQPALSLSVVSRLIYEPPLQTYIEGLDKVTQLVGLWVSDKTSRLQGEILKVVGQVDEHRERLIGLSQRDAMRAIIAQAPDDHWVLRVQAGRNEYDYVTDALQLLIRLEDMDRFDVTPAHMEKALHLKPGLRAEMVKVVSNVIKEAGLIGSAYSVQNAPHLFRESARTANMQYTPNRVRPYDAAQAGAHVQTLGLHRRLPRFDEHPVRVTVINALAEGVGDFMIALGRAMEREFSFRLEIVRERNMRVVSQANLESAVRLMQKEQFDVVLVFLPDEIEGADDDGVEARYAKAQTIGRGLPCLTIHESTLNKPETMYNIITGILARAGNVPYLLETPPDYTDLIVGLDWVTERRKDAEHLIGMSRIYGADGRLLRYIVAAGKVEAGEGIPESVLARLLPPTFMEGSTVILHHDGVYGREALRALGSWEAEIDATFYPVEIVQGGVPRLYALQGRKIDPAPRGTTFRLNNCEAFLLSSTSPYDSTPQPIHIRAEAPLTIETAIQSVLHMTLFHYGALKTPKLPVTIHNAEFITQGIARGVFPEDAEGSVAFWL
jgi:hypothetical protein